MSTRLYVSNTIPTYNPTTPRGDWTDTTSYVPNGRIGTKVNGTNNKTRAVASSTDKTMLGRWTSLPLGTSGTIPSTAVVSWVFGVLAPAGVTMVTHVNIYVTVGDSDTVRGTLLANADGATAWPTTAAGRGETNKALSSLAVTAGDRIVVEIGYKVTAGTSGNATLYFGNTGATDLTENSINVTTEPGWLEFTGFDTIFNVTGIAASTFVEGFNGSGTFTAGQSIPSGQMYVGNTTVTIGNGTATFPVNSLFNSVHMNPAYCVNLVGNSIYLDTLTIPVATNNAVYWELYFPAGNGSTSMSATVHDAYFQIFQGTVFTTTKIDGVSTSGTAFAYSATTTRYLRFREASGTLYLESSPDTTTWTVRHSTAVTIAIPLNRVDPACVASNTNTAITVIGGINAPGPLDTALLAGSGTLTTTALLTVSGVAALTGSGALAMDVALATTGATGLTGVGSLTAASSAASASSVASLSGSGSLAMAPVTVAPTGMAALSGSGVLNGTLGLPALGAPRTFSGFGSLTAMGGVPTYVGPGVLSGSGALTTSGAPNLVAAVALTGSGALGTVEAPGFPCAVALSGGGVLVTTQAAVGALGTASLAGSGASITTSGALTAAAPANLSGSGALAVVAGALSASFTASVTGSGTLSLTGLLAYTQIGVLSGSGQLSALQTAVATSRAVALSGSGSLAGSGTPAVVPNTLGFSGAGALTIGGTPATSTVDGLSGSGSLVTLAGSPLLIWGHALSGSGQLVGAQVAATASGVVVLTGYGGLTGLTRLSVVGSVVMAGRGALSTVGRDVVRFLGFDAPTVYTQESSTAVPALDWGS